MHSLSSNCYRLEQRIRVLNLGWVKKQGPGLFDVAMGSYDGAEVCELVGIFVLGQLPERYVQSEVGLYRMTDWQSSEMCRVVRRNALKRTLLDPLENWACVLPSKLTLELLIS